MPIREYRCANGHTTEDIYSRGMEPDTVDCPVCTNLAWKIASVPCFALSWVPTTYDVKDVWEGTELEGGGEPNKFTYKSDKIQVDWGQDRKLGANTKIAPASGWKAAQAAFKKTAKEAVKGI